MYTFSIINKASVHKLCLIPTDHEGVPSLVVMWKAFCYCCCHDRRNV